MVLISRRPAVVRRAWPVAALLAALVAVTVAGPTVAGARTGTSGRIEVVASAHPLAWAARAVGGDRVRVTDLTPPGVEPHDLELTTRDRDRIDRADVVLVVGGGFQPAVEAAAARRGDRSGPTVVLTDVLPGDDPHLWLDPVVWADAVSVVEQALTTADPAGATGFAERADAVRADLAALDAAYAEGLADCRHRLVVTVHDAFSRTAARYDLSTASLLGRVPDGEADARTFADLADRMERAGVTTVFTEPLAAPDLARTLAREGGARVAVLDPAESQTAAQRRRGEDYPEVMRQNLRALRRALDCT